MSSTPPIITEERGEPLVENERGLSGARRFSIVASSELNARYLLRTIKGIFYGVPWQSAYGEPYDDTAVARELHFRARTPIPVGGTGLVEALVRYGRRDSNEAVPFGRPVYRKGVSLEQKRADLDEDGEPAVNMVDEPFDPPLTRPEPNETWTVEWWWMNTTLDDWAQATRTYDAALNTLTWRGAPPLCVLCHGLINVEEVVLNDTVAPEILGIKTHGIFEYRRQIDPADLASDVIDKDGEAVSSPFSGFAELPLNRGYRKKVGTDGDGKPIYAVISGNNSAGLSQPVYIDADGDILNDADPAIAIAYLMNPRRADFNLLGI